MTAELPGFEVTPVGDSADGADDTDRSVTRRLVANQNRRKAKSGRGSGGGGGGFQAMGFSQPVLRGVLRRGYQVPTPIQRKCIPLIMDGGDVVAMARTGSGKTACFLLPLLERLQSGGGGGGGGGGEGARALVLSPTRELALQTVRFARELGRYCSLRVATVLGGESLDEQFAAMHARPDLIVATPGRLVHVCVEMRLRLTAVQYVVFDEADRLFELGFAEQLRELLARLPDSRQTLLFSATLPAALAEFARAGLSQPRLVRLDAEQKLSPRLQLGHLVCRDDERSAALLLLLHTLQHQQQSASQQQAEGEQAVKRRACKTLVFVSTRHHVEYVRQLLERAGIVCTHLYSSMDPEARRQNAERFRCDTHQQQKQKRHHHHQQQSSVDTMVVTDVAARGIDIPHLDYVINYNFPARPKLFVHRVGRVARAGRPGTAFSLLSPAELPYLLDLYLFLGQPLRLCGDQSTAAAAADGRGQLGSVPQQLLDSQMEQLSGWHDQCVELEAARATSCNANKQYVRTRPVASRESARRAKQLQQRALHHHQLFCHVDAPAAAGDGSAAAANGGDAAPGGDGDATAGDGSVAAATAVGVDTQTFQQLLTALRTHKTGKTIFEVGARRGTCSEAARVMKAKRQRDAAVLQRAALNHRQGEPLSGVCDESAPQQSAVGADDDNTLDLADQFQIADRPPSKGARQSGERQQRQAFRDTTNYIPYRSEQCHADAGYTVSDQFDKVSGQAVLDLAPDNVEEMHGGRAPSQRKHWDLKKRRYVGDANDGKQRKIKTESGVWISASFERTGRYDQWKKSNHVDAQCGQELTTGSDQRRGPEAGRGGRGVKVMGRRVRGRPDTGFSGGRGGGPRQHRTELRSKEQILRRRDEAERRQRRSTVGVGARGSRGGRPTRGHSSGARAGSAPAKRGSFRAGRGAKFSSRGGKSQRNSRR